MSDEDCDRLFKRVDENADGRIVFEEFVDNLVNADVWGIMPAESSRSKSVMEGELAKPSMSRRSQSVLGGPAPGKAIPSFDSTCTGLWLGRGGECVVHDMCMCPEARASAILCVVTSVHTGDAR